MVDRVYKAGVPALRKDLERLRESFAQLDSRTDWVKLRIEPLLDHVKSLERLLVSREHAREFSRLTRGVAMFHSDLVYFRTNVQALEKILEPERKGLARRRKKEGNRRD